MNGPLNSKRTILWQTLLLTLVAIFAAGVAGCAGTVKHIAPYKPRTRHYTPPENLQQESNNNTAGAIWSPHSRGNYFFSDHRALMVNDVVQIRIEESSSAEGTASTALGKESSTGLGIEKFFGLMAKLKEKYPDVDPTKLLSANFASDFSGSGSTKREGKFVATVAAQIRQVLPNGNFFIEGHKVVQINNEEQHFYISGVIRPHDIANDNSIESSLIADAELEFTGRGDITDKQEQGWFNKAMDKVNPF